MKILFAKKMTRQYWKLRAEDRKRVDDAIENFRKDPFAPALKNHPLKGPMKGARAISAGFDLRIIFEEHEGYAVLLVIAVGTHGDVY